MSSRSNGVKDADQSFVDFLVCEQGVTFGELAKSRGTVRRQLKQPIALMSGKKAETIAAVIGGTVACLAGLMIGAIPLAGAGAVVLAMGGFKFQGSNRDLEFACKEIDFLAQNGFVLDVFAHIEESKSITAWALVDTYNDLLQWAIGYDPGRILPVSKERLREAIATQADAIVGGFHAAHELSENMKTGALFNPAPAAIAAEVPIAAPREDDSDDEDEEPYVPPFFTNLLSQPVGQSKQEGDVFSALPSASIATQSIEGIERQGAIDVPAMIAKDVYSYAIISPPGGGKGMLISHAIRLIKAKRPDISIVLADPKDDPREAGYWDGVVDLWLRCNFLEMNATSKSEWIRSALSRYQQISGAKILILDEATAQFAHLKAADRPLLEEMKSFMTGIASSGNSRENYCWIVGHTPNLEDYGISGGQMSSFRKIYIAPSNNVEVIKQLGSTMFTGGKFGADQVAEICKFAAQSPVSRAVYLGATDRWYPMVRLQNYSQYDRDSRQVSAAAQSTVKFVDAFLQSFTGAPSDDEINVVGRILTERLRSVRSNPAYAEAASHALLQSGTLAQGGQKKESIALMIRSLGLSPTQFKQLTEHHSVYEWAVEKA